MLRFAKHATISTVESAIARTRLRATAREQRVVLRFQVDVTAIFIARLYGQTLSGERIYFRH
jgi:hypothetical protein